MTGSTDFQVINSRGTVIRTFDGIDARKRAIAWAKSRDALLAHVWLEVREVTVTVTSIRVYRPRVYTTPRGEREGAAPSYA